MSSNSNRYPSPVFARPNPNLRATELNNPIRRSFTGSPFNKPSVPSNPRSLNSLTPESDLGQRNSMDRNGGLFYNNTNEKENEKDQILKTVKMRSPSVPKNFMAPTISTASKITSASPRKKVLTDRNEPIRNSSSSVNLFESMENHDSKPRRESSLKKIDPLVDSKETPNSNVIGYSKLNVDGGSNSMFMISPSPGHYSPCPVIAPLDADPLVAPPYDPKTNYLSPRPQFLHYRPNPRVTFNLKEEILNFESLSDGETTEETESEELVIEANDDSSVQKEDNNSYPISTRLPIKTSESKVVVSATEELLAPTEDDSSVEKEPKSEELLAPTEDDSSVKKETESEELLAPTEDDSSVETEIDHTDLINTNVDIQSGESKGVLNNKHFYSRLKPVSLLLIMAVACLSISMIDNPIIDTPQFKDRVFLKNYDDPYEIMKHVKENYDGVARKFSFWSANCIGYFTKLIHLTKIKQKVSELHLFHNLTTLQDDPFLDGKFRISISTIMGDQIESIEEHGYNEIEEFVNGDALESQDDLFLDEHVTIGISNEMGKENDPIKDEEGHIKIKEFDNKDGLVLFEVEGLDELENPVVLSLETNGREVESDNKIQELILENYHEIEEISDNSKLTVSNDIYGIPTSLETLDSTNNDNPGAKLSSMTTVLGISLLATGLIIATAVFAAKQRKSYEPNEMATKMAISSAGWTRSMSVPNEVDMMSSSDPCQSDLSSFEAHGIERKRMIKTNLKRESLATSSDFSMDSPSYGSFTTYEIIQRKLGGDEERMVTPVRRSSRIRSHATSS